MEELRDDKFQRFVINVIIPFPVMLDKAGLEGYNYDGKCFCPFHDNYDSPAAKLYKNPTGDNLFCFSERRQYKPSDVIDKGLLKKSLQHVFNNIWKQLTEDKKEYILQLYSEPIDFVPQKWKDNKHLLDLFKNGEDSFTQHIEIIRKCLE